MDRTLDNVLTVYNLLEDEQSRDIFLKRLNYNITKDFKYIRDIVTAYAPQLVTWDGRSFPDLITSLPKDREFVLYGAGADAAMLLEHCVKDTRFVGFCAATKEKQKNGYLGYPVMSPEELFARKDLSVVISTSRARA